MKMVVTLTNPMIKVLPAVYGPTTIKNEKKQKVLYIKVGGAFYRCLKIALKL